MCDICTNGVVAKHHSEIIYCNFCTEGIEGQLAEMTDQLTSMAAELAGLDALDTLGRLSKEGQAWRDAIEEEFKRLCFEHDTLEAKYHELAAA